MVRQDPNAEKYDSIQRIDEGRIVHFLGRSIKNSEPTTQVMFTGIQIMEPEIFSRIPENKFCGTVEDIFPGGSLEIVAASSDNKKVTLFYDSGNLSFSNSTVLADDYNVNYSQIIDIDKDSDLDVVFAPFQMEDVHQAHNPHLGGAIVGLAEIAINSRG